MENETRVDSNELSKVDSSTSKTETPKKEPEVRISYDEMDAYVTLPLVSSDVSYNVKDIMDALSNKRVTYGIDQEKILELIQHKVYGKEIHVAKGEPKVDGEDGYFTYHFNTDLNKKPTIREDGSVDYWSIHAIEVVEEGQVIAEYTEPVDGKNGMSVKGKTIMAKRGRPMPPLTGRGFDRSEDNKTYTANISGKIELNKNRIMILPVYEVSGDADLTIGNIDFRGDVIIHGNVLPGESIKCTGSITIDGTSEACTLSAGKDIILRGGVIGGEKAKITAKGNIIAKFIEYATVEAEGFIEADSAMNSEITSYDRLMIHGGQGTVVGGSVFGCAGVEIETAGNAAEIRTEIGAGIHRKMREKKFQLEANIQDDQEIIDKLENGIRQFDAMAEEKGVDLSNDDRRLSLLRTKIEKQSQLYADKEELERLEGIETRAENATIRVVKSVFPGVELSIDDIGFKHKYKDNKVEFYRIGDKIRMIPLQD